MTTITRKRKHCPDGRFKHPKITRNRPRNIVPVTLPMHDLTHAMVHRYTLNPMVMAVKGVAIEQHDLVKVDGEVLKVVSVESVSEGCVEIRTLKFGRYQGE